MIYSNVKQMIWIEFLKSNAAQRLMLNGGVSFTLNTLSPSRFNCAVLLANTALTDFIY